MVEQLRMALKSAGDPTENHQNVQDHHPKNSDRPIVRESRMSTHLIRCDNCEYYPSGGRMCRTGHKHAALTWRKCAEFKLKPGFVLPRPPDASFARTKTRWPKELDNTLAHTNPEGLKSIHFQDGDVLVQWHRGTALNAKRQLITSLADAGVIRRRKRRPSAQRGVNRGRKNRSKEQ